jgi:hypothetical protein
MTKDALSIVAKNALRDLLEQPGEILYSSHETIKPGLVYLLGLNPGGEGGLPLIKSVDQLLKRNTNAYLDECWENLRGSWKAGEAPLQRRVVWLLENLGLCPREVCASNLIFVQSRDARGVSFELAKKCWPVHEAIIDIVKPRLIIAFGNSCASPYFYLHDMLNGKQTYAPSGHGNWLLKGFHTNIAGQGVFVAGLPHLSRYSPIGKPHVVEWLKAESRI